MFATEESLKRRTGKNDVDRLQFLKLLVNEFKVSQSKDAKEQVLANLANFAYDPINYGFIRELQIIDIFLDELSDINGQNVEFAIAGLCNLCLDRENKEYIIANSGIRAVSNCLSSANEEIVISAITTLLFLVTPQSKPEITSSEIVQFMLNISKVPNPRLKNLAGIFLSDLCSKEQVHEAELKISSVIAEISSIPLP